MLSLLPAQEVPKVLDGFDWEPVAVLVSNSRETPGALDLLELGMKSGKTAVETRKETEDLHQYLRYYKAT